MLRIAKRNGAQIKITNMKTAINILIIAVLSVAVTAITLEVVGRKCDADPTGRKQLRLEYRAERKQAKLKYDTERKQARLEYREERKQLKRTCPVRGQRVVELPVVITPEKRPEDLRIEEQQRLERLQSEENKRLAGLRIKQKMELEATLKELERPFDGSSYRNSDGGVKAQIALFKTWAGMIREEESSDDADIRNLAGKLKGMVANIQAKEFPLLRRDGAKFMAKHGINVHVSGDGNRHVNFTGDLFSATRNIEAFHAPVRKMLEELRFTRANYRWFRYQDIYDSFTVYSGRDTDPVN